MTMVPVCLLNIIVLLIISTTYCTVVQAQNGRLRYHQYDVKAKDQDSTRKRENDSNEECDAQDYLYTDLISTTGSYGNMFDIETKSKAIEIYQLEFYTDVTEDVNFRVWTKSGSYLGCESSEELWREVATGTTKGLGSLSTTPIPKEMSTPVHVSDNSIQSFIVTLDSPDIRYSSPSRGGLLRDNEHISLYVGNGVAQFPPFHEKGTYFSPRSWNGSINYSFIDVCSEIPSHVPSQSPTKRPSVEPTPIPTSQPTHKPTITPTITPSMTAREKTEYPTYWLQTKETTVTYSFILEHDPSFLDFLFNDVSQIITETLQNVFMSNIEESNIREAQSVDGNLVDLIQEGDLRINSVYSSLNHEKNDVCTPSSFDVTCMPIESVVILSHKSSINSDKVKYTLHTYASAIRDKLSNYSAQYTGPKTDSAEADIQFNGVSQEVFNDDVSSETFEDTLLDFLKETMDVNATIADVEILDYEIIEIRRFKSRELNGMDPSSGTSISSDLGEPLTRGRDRIHESNMTYSLDVTVLITGEYQPPPDIALDEVVQESFDNDADTLIETLKESDISDFKNVTGVKVKRIEKVVPDPHPRIEEKEKLPTVMVAGQNIASSFVWTQPLKYTLLGVVSCVAVLSITICIWMFKKKRTGRSGKESSNENDYDTITTQSSSEVLQFWTRGSQGSNLGWMNR